MSIHAIPMTDQTLMRWLIASGVLLASAFVLAEGDARLDAPPAYGEILSDDIYDRANGWREPELPDSEWRAPKTEPKSRIKFGYDSTYEELRAREADTGFSSKPIKQGDLRPNTQFKLGF